MYASALRRDAMPACARNFCRRTRAEESVARGTSTRPPEAALGPAAGPVPRLAGDRGFGFGFAPGPRFDAERDLDGDFSLRFAIVVSFLRAFARIPVLWFVLVGMSGVFSVFRMVCELGIFSVFCFFCELGVFSVFWDLCLF